MAIKKYKIIVAPTAYREIIKIYDYITENLYAKNAAKKLLQKIEKAILMLKYAPEIHTKIKKNDELQRCYRRIVINNYVIIYTVDEEHNTVYIAHMYYGRRNYIDNNLL